MRSAPEQVMTLASKVLTRADVMEGVADMIPWCRSSISRSRAPVPAALCRFRPPGWDHSGAERPIPAGFIPARTAWRAVTRPGCQPPA